MEGAGLDAGDLRPQVVMGGELRAWLDHDPAQHHGPPRCTLHPVGLCQRVADRRRRRFGLAESGWEQGAQDDADRKRKHERRAGLGERGHRAAG
jgi:hypothetical protein